MNAQVTISRGARYSVVGILLNVFFYLGFNFLASGPTSAEPGMLDVKLEPKVKKAKGKGGGGGGGSGKRHLRVNEQKRRRLFE